MSVPGLPSCAQSCATDHLPANCNNDAKCICQSSSFIDEFLCCIASACSVEDQQNTLASADSICASAGVSGLPQSATCPSNTAPQSAVSSSAVPSTPTASTTSPSSNTNAASNSPAKSSSTAPADSVAPTTLSTTSSHATSTQLLSSAVISSSNGASTSTPQASSSQHSSSVYTSLTQSPTTSPTSSTSNIPTSSVAPASDSSEGLSPGLIEAIGAGAGTFVLVILAIFFFILRRRRRQRAIREQVQQSLLDHDEFARQEMVQDQSGAFQHLIRPELATMARHSNYAKPELEAQVQVMRIPRRPLPSDNVAQPTRAQQHPSILRSGQRSLHDRIAELESPTSPSRQIPTDFLSYDEGYRGRFG